MDEYQINFLIWNALIFLVIWAIHHFRVWVIPHIKSGKIMDSKWLHRSRARIYIHLFFSTLSTLIIVICFLILLSSALGIMFGANDMYFVLNMLLLASFIIMKGIIIYIFLAIVDKIVKKIVVKFKH